MVVASRGSDQFMLRLPDGMRARIKNIAAKNGRSMNSEIVYQLERSFAQMATGEGLGNSAPVASSNNTALQGGASINHG